MAKSPLPPAIERRMRARIQIWQRLANKDERDRQAEQKPPFLTISRQFGCTAFELSKALAAGLETIFPEVSFEVYDRKLLELLADDDEMLSEMVNSFSKRTKTEMNDWLDSTFSGKPPELKVYRHLARTQVTLASAGSCILIGRGGALTTRHLKNGIHIRMIAPINWRIEELKKIPERRDSTTRDVVERYDREREGFVRKYMGIDITDPVNYDLVLNNEKLTTNEQASLVISLVKSRWDQ